MSKERGKVEIVKTPGVCGGRAAIAGTRMPVWFIIQWMKTHTAEEFLEDYPGLDPADLEAAFFWYLDHKDEIEHDIQENST
jgi:uncharacterized protein (DUF433 family)